MGPYRQEYRPFHNRWKIFVFKQSLRLDFYSASLLNQLKEVNDITQKFGDLTEAGMQQCGYAMN